MIKNISIASDTSGTFAFAHVSADIFREIDKEKLQSLLSVDTVLIFPEGDSASYSPALDNSLDVLYALTLDTTRADVSKADPQTLGNGVPQTVYYREDSILRSAKSYYTLPILSDTVYKKGIYMSLQEFQQNNPSVMGPLWAVPDTLSDNGSARLYVLAPDSSARLVSGAWGICFGGNEIYKLQDGQLIPIERSGKGFVLSRYQEFMTRKNQALLWRRIVSAGWPDDANPYERKRSLPVGGKSTATHRPVATRIDIRTGELTF